MVTVTQKEVLDTQVAEGKVTPQQVTLLQKMGLANPSRSTDIDADVAAVARGDLVKAAQAGVKTADTLVKGADTLGIGRDAAAKGRETAANALASAQKSQSTAELQVVTALGLKPAIDMGTKLNAPQNAAVKTIIEKHTGEFATNAKFDPFLKAMGGRIQQDPSIIDALGKQLADPKLAERFERDMVQQPAKMAELVKNYDPKTFSKQLAAVDGEPEIIAAAVPTPAPKPAADGKQRSQHSTVGVTAAAPAQAANAPAPAPVGSPGVVMIATDVVASVHENFPELDQDAKGFMDRINSDPALQVRIKAQLDKNPEFLKQLESMKSGQPLSEGVKKTMRPFVQEFLNNPDELGTDDGMKRTIQKFGKTKSEATMSGVTDWVKNTLGFDMSGMMDGMKGFFQQIGNWFKGIMGQFSGGNFQSMRNSGMGMFPALQNASMMAAAYGRYNPSDMTAYPLKGADGQIFHKQEYTTKDENGNDVKKTRDVPNTLSVTSINGTEHKYIPAAGLVPKQDTQGNWHVSMITDVNLPSGSSKSIDPDVVLSPAEFAKFKAASEANMNGRKLGEVAYVPTVVTQIDPRTGRESAPVTVTPQQPQPGAQSFPVAPQPGLEVRELSPTSA